MARRARLTPFAKLLIVIVVVGGAYFLATQFGLLDGLIPSPDNNNTNNSNSNIEETSQIESGDVIRRQDDIIDIGVVTWGGYAGGQYWNNGFEPTEASRFYKDYGFAVKFHVLDEFLPSREAFNAGKIDLLWCTIDAFPTESADLDAQVVFQADWSRGGDAIVVRRGINSVSDLKGKSVAVAEGTPSHTFLIWLLEAGGLSMKDINLVKVESAIDAANVFKSQKCDAAVVWSPDDQACVEAVRGSKVLENTKNASNIIADVFLAKKSYVNSNKERLVQLYEGWMKGAAEINASETAKEKAAKILSEGLKVPEDFALNAINNVRLVTHGDNLNFFGINNDYNGVTGQELYTKMGTTYQNIEFIPKNIRVPNYRMVATTDIVKNANLNGVAGQEAEGKKTFTKVTKEDEEKEAISSKQVRISFRSGEFKLDENSKYIIDSEFADIARTFSNARIRIEGNTDNVGNAANNKKLSYLRAQSVAQYLQQEYGFDENRFVIVGNGSDKPLADNSTADGRAANRRTDFELIAE